MIHISLYSFFLVTPKGRKHLVEAVGEEGEDGGTDDGPDRQSRGGEGPTSRCRSGYLSCQSSSGGCSNEKESTCNLLHLHCRDGSSLFVETCLN